MLIRSESSWTATLLATQSRGRARRDWWLKSVTNCEMWIDAPELDCIERWRRGVLRSSERGSSWTIPDIYAPRSGIPIKIEIQSDSSTVNSLTDRLEQDSERSTLTRGTFGYKNESKMETSVSRRCLQRRTAHMLERSQSLLTVLQQHCKFEGLVFY